MTDASGGNRDPGQSPVTADELLASPIRGGNILDDAARTELTTALGGITTQSSGLELQGESYKWPDQLGKEWAAEAASQIKKILEGHSGSRLLEIVGQVFGDEEEKLTDLPPAEQLQQVVNLDTLIRMAAGQPVVVLKPGKTWMDIGLLETPQGGADNNIGLQRSYDVREATSSIVLPVHKSLTMDIKTAKELDLKDQQDDELRARAVRPIDAPGEPTRPVIAPLTTRVLLAAENARSTPDDAVTTYVLVGYTQLQQTLNRILGFDMSRIDSDNDDEAKSKLYAALQIQKRLEEHGIVFDIDFIDGYLAYRIDVLERAIQESGPLKTMSLYQETALDDMRQKFARLTDDGWISKQSAKT